MSRLFFSCLLVLFCGLEAFPSEVMQLKFSSEGSLVFPGGEIAVEAHLPGWRAAKIRMDYALFKDVGAGASETFIRPFKIRGRADEVLFAGSYEWTAESEKLLKGKLRVVCAADCNMQRVALAARVPSPPVSGMGRKALADYQLPVDGNRVLLLSFPRKTKSLTQDTRRWGGKWSMRFGEKIEGGTFAKGDAIEWNFTLSALADDSFKLIPARTVTIKRGERWAPLEYRKDVLKGSALDFSGMGLQDAPAGKYGWLRAVGGHFEFEGRPGVEQRFYGVNLCFSANYLTHEDADMVIERLVRSGYNSIRIHHHDGLWYKSDENKERLDYLIAKAIEKGLYVTTDLYVSREVKWRDVGIDRDGVMPNSFYKAYIGLHEAAFKDWALHSRRFLEHVNPYTGRAYKDEPGMPLVSLVNEGRISMSWDKSGKAQDTIIEAAWKEFGGTGPLPKMNMKDRTGPFCRFDEWTNARVWKRCSDFVRSIGCRALLSNDNDGRWHSEGEGLTPLYDYVDNHFYIDLPQFLGTSWRLPSRSSNENPIKNRQPKIFNNGWAKGASKPYTITEWNFVGPGRYRAMGGILTGCLASKQEWDGLWRFAFSHSNKSLKDGEGSPGYFNSTTDPLVSASDRASICLYLRGDAHGSVLKTDVNSGEMSVVSAKTCGGFTEGGTVHAGVLSFRTKPKDNKGEGMPTSLWVSSLDGKILEKTSRMLLVHLTDVQGEGALYADEKRQIILKWGKRCLVESGSAEVSLKIESPSDFKIYELDTSGRRMCVIPSRIVNGTLCFTVSTSGPRGGRMYYEIVSGR